MASSLMAAQAAVFLRGRPPAFAPPITSSSAAPLSLPPSSTPRLTLKPRISRISASLSPVVMTKSENNNPNQAPPDILSGGSTRTVTTIFALALSLARFVTHRAITLTVQLKEPLLKSAGPAFFAAMRDVPSGSLNTPFTVVAAGMAKWLDLYSGVLMVRVLLSWFPNIPWDRQPLSAIRDLCDPYLNLFRNIIPPIFDTLDVSPLLAFAVLGTLATILNNSRAAS
ncbi:ylmG homolog protein 1-2, chloroplastic-like [Andrographis paniculata]|uniref:ylmG homolog protein 1-2, chloroplastic-like n=1 Tax=Andrographis paniculata TaxID=175694 RepID=UPI0021E8DEDF|nr:ylmG homolog protein 1-2, chloroplastic-like [Andrographis paniculata]